VQLLWEFQALGFGNRTRIDERRAEYEAATLELFRTQDRIAAEVVAAFARVRAAAERVNDAEPALREAVELVNKMTEGLGQTRRIGDALVLIVRPQEATAAVQAFAQASTDFFAAVADYNRAQFQLYRALGHPAQCLAGAVAGDPASENKPAQALPPPADLSVEEPHPAVTVRPASAVTPAVDALPPPLSLRPPVVVQERER
jgi:outer membrane protein TolC